MVCPNCHSDQVIAVQDQHFCINCGQQVSESAVTASKKAAPAIAVQANGLPEGVKILTKPGSTGPLDTSPSSEQPSAPDGAAPIVKPRARIPDPSPGEDGKNAPDAEMDPDTHPPKLHRLAKKLKRKPGRPKAGRLDAPKAVPLSVAATSTDAPSPGQAPDQSLKQPTPDRPKVMSDLSPRRQHGHDAPPAADEPQKPPALAAIKKKQKQPKHKVHKVGLPPIHYGSVLAYSLHARLRPRHLGLAAAASLTLAAVIAFAVWELLTLGLTHLARGLEHVSRQSLIEVLLLAGLYYVGRSIGQAAITYGVAREADDRPVTLSRQIAVAVNTFGRRLILDAGFGLISLCLIYLIIILVSVGGSVWPLSVQWQVVGLFAAFLLILYLMTALALSRGLGSVALTLTNLSPRESAALGWKLFSHRFELLGLRFLALAMELVLAVPLAALALALVIAAPGSYHLAVALTVGLLAWIAGALLGAGTAAWWAKLYRNLVLADHPDKAVSMMSGRQVLEPRPLPLTVIVSISTLLLAAVLALPWISFA